MKKMYTAIGQLRLKGSANGKRYPVVVVHGEEYTLDPAEMTLWTTLYWRFLSDEELDRQYEKKKIEAGVKDERKAESVLYWLLYQGLIGEGNGETQEDALYDLLAGMYVTPISESPILAAATFLKMVFVDKLPLSMAKQAFHRDTKNAGERTIMQITRQVRLSVAEIVRCVERGVLDITSEDEIVERLYEDDYTTEANIADEMRGSPVRRDVLSDVANLYLRRQLVFERK